MAAYKLHSCSLDVINGRHKSVVCVGESWEMDIGLHNKDTGNQSIAVQTVQLPYTLTELPLKTKTLLLSDILCLSPQSHVTDHKFGATVFLHEQRLQSAFHDFRKLQEVMNDYDIADRTICQVYYSQSGSSPFGHVWKNLSDQVKLEINWNKGSVKFHVSHFGSYCVVLTSELNKPQVLPYLNTASKTANEMTYRLTLYRKVGEEDNRFIFNLVPVTKNVEELLFKPSYQQHMFSVSSLQEIHLMFVVATGKYTLQDDHIVQLHLVDTKHNMQAATLEETDSNEDSTHLNVYCQNEKFKDPFFWFSVPLVVDQERQLLTKMKPNIYKDFTEEKEIEKPKVLELDLDQNSVYRRIKQEVYTAIKSKPVPIPPRPGINSSHAPGRQFRTVGSAGKTAWNALMRMLDSGRRPRTHTYSW